MKTIRKEGLEHLFQALREKGFTLVGPTLGDGAIVYDELESVDDLPAGYTDRQDGGTYRLEKRDDGALFGYVVGPHSWKKIFFPPAIRLLRAERRDGTLHILDQPTDTTRYALIGVRSCELAALAVQDRVFQEGQWVDPLYQARRAGAFIVAVQCGQAGGTCFCVSMDTGPKARSGFDLALTEVIDGEDHYFVAESGSEAGAEILAELPGSDATGTEEAAAEAAVERAATQMGRELDTDGLPELLQRQAESPHWDKVAEHCLACSNCTLVCPTCFCSTVEDTTDLTGTTAERWRKWDSCFTSDFSYLHGGSVRTSTASRYRQWMTHKLSTWMDQFGTSGCVGCGRCITWCPVGIDITAEAKALRTRDDAAESKRTRP